MQRNSSTDVQTPQVGQTFWWMNMHFNMALCEQRTGGLIVYPSFVHTNQIKMHVHPPNTKKFALPEAFARQWMNCVARFNPKRGLRSAVTPGWHQQGGSSPNEEASYKKIDLSAAWHIRLKWKLWKVLQIPLTRTHQSCFKDCWTKCLLKSKVWIAVFFFFYILGYSLHFLAHSCSGCVALCTVCVCAW